jgi:hypothetical protein
MTASGAVALAASGYRRAVRTIPKQRRQRPLYPGDPRRAQGARANRHGLTPAQVEALVRMQDGLCALCRRPLGDDFVIDHDHVLAEAHGHNPNVGCPRCVRGALDLGCNTWLAGFRDDPAFLTRAAQYAGRRRAG